MEEKEIELRDEGLRGNEKIEEAIAGLQQEPTQEMLAHALTVVRRRMKENGQLIVAVEPPAGGGQLLLQTVKTSDSKLWWAAFTENTLTQFFTITQKQALVHPQNAQNACHFLNYMLQSTRVICLY